MISDQIRNKAIASGIDVIGFTDASPFSDYILENSIRRNPKITLPEAQSIIIVGIYIGGITLPVWEDSEYGRTSRLYLSGFFLDVNKPLEPIAQLLKNEGYKAIICDSSHEKSSILPLKLAAVRAGLGWQGKHTLFISKKYGSFLALGGIITDAVLDYCTEQESNKCGNCNRCQLNCPLGAIDKPFRLDRNRCLSNILQTEMYPEKAKNKAENRIGDCEICQEVCPWNKKHIKQPLNTEMTKKFKNNLELLQKKFILSELRNMTAMQYEEVLGKYHTDISFSIFLRNVKVAMNNEQKYL